MFFRILLDVCVPIFGIVAAGWLMDRKFKLHLETLVKLNIAFGFSREVSAAPILAAAAPTAVNTALLAHEFGGDVSISTSAVYYSTLLSLITTPALVFALKLWL